MARGHMISAYICAIGSITGVVGIAFSARWPDLRSVTAQAYMAIGCGSLFAVSMISGQHESYTPVFFCCAGLLAGHLLGIRAAAIWTIVALGCILLINFGFAADAVRCLEKQDTTDYLLNTMGLTSVIFFMAQQSEAFFDKHATRLVGLMEELQEQTRLLSMAEEVAEVGHWRLDMKSGRITYSPVACTICELKLESSEPQPLATFLAPFPKNQARQLQEAISLVRADADTNFSLELSFLKDDRHRFIRIKGFSEFDSNGHPEAIFGIIKDETATKLAAAQLNEKAAALQKLAAFDVLTGLANRYRFQSELQEAIQQSKANNTQSALLLIDMDSFKDVNDTLGHSTGDEILRMIANRLIGCADEDDTVARLGGDEFTLILNNISDVDDVFRQAFHISDVITQPYFLSGKEIHLDASIGAALCPSHSEFMDELLAFADTAMYEAKASKQRLAVYDPRMTDGLVHRRKMEAALAQALARNEFHLLYQPQFRIDGKSIVGFEALLRWEHQGRVVSPVEFVPLLEQSGAILPVGEWILHEACRQAQEWICLGHNLTISVNISPVQFHERDFVETVVAALDATGLDPRRLDLEVTESVFIDDVAITAEKLFQVKDHGVSISIDDFGTGYSSLSYLKHFPIDRLKIDRAFVKDFPSRDDGTIASSIVGLGHNLEMRVLAEGVETLDQLSFLSDENCDEIQGFLFSKPITPEEGTALLHQCANNQFQAAWES